MRLSLYAVHRWPRAFLDWLCAGREDYHRFRERRRSPRYRALIGRCKTVWIVTGLLIALQPSFPVALTLVLLTTILSFILLDESHDTP